MADARRYWIVQTDLSIKGAENKWMLESREEFVAHESTIQSSDIVFLWSRRDQNICGWGTVIAKPIRVLSAQSRLRQNLPSAPIEKASGGEGGLQLKVIVMPEALFREG